MNADGGCHCGFIRFEVEIDPAQVLVCHCTDCQTLSASAFRTVAFVAERSFKLLNGEMKTYVKTAESGNKRAQTFCPECGTHIYAASTAKAAIARELLTSGARVVHLFVGAPSPLALFLGHRLNAVGEVQCYEWIGEGAYVPTCRFFT